MVLIGRLYPLLLGCVLAVAGCRGGTPESGVSGAETQRQSTPEGSTPPTGITVLFFGDSITAGYGLDPSQAFPALVGRRAAGEGLPIRIVNAGLSGETTAAGVRRIGWVLRESVDVFVLELGGNDALRGVDLSSTARNLQAIVDSVRTRNPGVRIVVAGMRIPPNLGLPYTRRFQNLYPELAEANDAVLIPFLLDGVAGVGGMMQADGIHPTARGHEVMAELVWEVLEPEIRNLLADGT